MGPIPWGVHRLHNIFGGPDIRSGLPDGRWVTAVGEPYHGTFRERLRAAWWVLTGRAYAVVWPKPGELEDVLKGGSKMTDITPEQKAEWRKETT